MKGGIAVSCCSKIYDWCPSGGADSNGRECPFHFDLCKITKIRGTADVSNGLVKKKVAVYSQDGEPVIINFSNQEDSDAAFQEIYDAWVAAKKEACLLEEARFSALIKAISSCGGEQTPTSYCAQRVCGFNYLIKPIE